MGGLRKYLPITYWTCLIGVAGADRLPGLRRVLLQGRAHRGGARLAPAGRDLRLLVRAARRVRDGVLLVPPVVPDVPRRGADGRPHAGAPAREPVGRDAAAGAARDPVGGHRLAHDRARCCSATTSATRSGSLPAHDVLGHLGEEFHGPAAVRAAWAHGRRRCGSRRPACSRPGSCTSGGRSSRRDLRERAGGSTRCSSNKYYFDDFNEKVLAARQPWRSAGALARRRRRLIDGAAVNGSARARGLGRRAVARHCSPATSITMPSR